MKKRSVVALMAVVTLLVSLLAGCGGGDPVKTMTPREILAKAIEKQNEVVSSKFAFDLSFDTSGVTVNNSEDQQVVEALKTMKLNLSGENDSKRPFTYLLAKVDVTVEGERHAFDAKLYSDGQKLLLNVPYVYKFLPDASMQKEYYILNSALLEQAGEGMQSPVNPQMMLGSTALKALSVYTAQAYLGVLPDSAITDMGEQEVDINGSAVKARGLSLNISKADVLAFLSKTVELYDDAKWNELNFAYMQELDAALTKEAYDAQMAQQKSEAQTALEEAQKSITDDTNFKFDTYIDNDFNMVAMKGTLAIGGNDDDMSGVLKLIFDGKMWDYNKASEMQLPETTPANSLDLSEMM